MHSMSYGYPWVALVIPATLSLYYVSGYRNKRQGTYVARPLVLASNAPRRQKRATVTPRAVQIQNSRRRFCMKHRRLVLFFCAMVALCAAAPTLLGQEQAQEQVTRPTLRGFFTSDGRRKASTSTPLREKWLRARPFPCGSSMPIHHETVIAILA